MLHTITTAVIIRLEVVVKHICIAAIVGCVTKMNLIFYGISVLKIIFYILQHEDPTHTEVSLTSPNSDNALVAVGTAEKTIELEVKGQPVRCSTRVVKKVKLEPAIPTVSIFALQ